MFTRLSFLTLAMVGIAGVAHAQSASAPAATMQSSGSYQSSGAAAGVPMQPRGSERYQAMTSDGVTHPVAMTDEYGFKYDAKGDRLDARGHIIAPPVTPPGGRALK